MADFAKLVLDADTRGLKKGEQDLKSLGKQAGSTAVDVDSMGFKIGAAMRRLIGPAAIAGAVAGFGMLTKSVINTADEISKAAQKIGIATEELSRLRYAADLSGVSFQSLQQSIGFLSRNMLAASEGTGEAGKAFSRLGVEVRNADGTLRNSTAVLGDLADRFASMPDGAEKTALAMQVLGKSGRDMIPMLNGGREALEKLTAEASKFGVVIDEETGRRAEEFNDNITRLQGTFSALAARVAADLLPRLIELQGWFIRNQESIVGAVRDAMQFAQTLLQLARYLSPLIAGFVAYRAVLLAGRLAVLAYGVAMTAFAHTVTLARGSTLALNAALAANPFGAVALAVGVLATAFIGLRNAQAEARAETNNLITSLKGLAQARSADFASKFASTSAQLAETNAKIAETRRNLAVLESSPEAGRGIQRAQLVQQLKTLTERSGQLSVGLTQSQRAFQAAGAAAQSIEVPAGNATAAMTSLGKATGGASDMAKAANDNFASLYDRLFPYQAASRKFAEEMALIQQSRLSMADKEEAITRLEREAFRNRTARLGPAAVSRGLLSEGPLTANLPDLTGYTVEQLKAQARAEEVLRTTGDVAASIKILQEASAKASTSIGDSFGAMADRALAALDRLANGIRGGGFLDILSGIIGLGIQLGGMGVFGKGVQANIRSQSFDGGGFTGSGPRSGGVDGKGGFMAVLHPNETVIDHTKGGKGQGVHVTVGIDPRNGNITAFVDGQIAAIAPAIASAGANVAQARMARQQSRRVA
jgi:hypothetical protein